MARKTSKICLVCGNSFDGTMAKITCSNACRTAMSRMIANGKKPEYWIIAKGKGQKIPTFNQKKKVVKEIVDSIEYLEQPNISETITNFIPKEILTKEQIEAKIDELNKQISDTMRQQCPIGKHPKMFKLEQSGKIDEIKAKIEQLKYQTK